MKALRTLLFLVLVIVVLAIGTLFFSGKIIESKLNTSEVQTEKFKFSLKRREVTFDNIIINGNSLGPGHGKLGLKRLFSNIFDNKIGEDKVHYGCPISKEELAKKYNLNLTSKPYRISENLCFLGEIENNKSINL